MKIIKYSKSGSNKYKVYLEDGSNILLHEDVILKNDLLIKKEILDVDSLIKENDKYLISDVALKYLSHKVHSVKEMREYLEKKGYLTDDIERVINELLKKGYLSDIIYCHSYISDRFNLSNDGPLKIKKYLESQNIKLEIYINELEKIFNQDVIYERINKYINKMIKVNKKSKYVLKNKIIINLINLGYYKEDIDYCLDSLSNIDDSNNKEKERIKIYNKLSKKYSGSELTRKLKEKMYQLGYFD